MAKHNEKPYSRVNAAGKKVWVARYTAHDGRRLSAGTYARKNHAQDAINAAHEQPAPPENQGTLGAYLPQWLSEHPVSERTTQSNRERINAVLDVKLEGRKLKDWPLHELRRRHAKELVAHMLTVQQRAPEGARGILRALSVLAEDAITDECADGNPWRGVRIRDDDKRAVKSSRQPRVWTFEQMHEVAECAGQHQAMIRVMADCGARIGEVFALRRSGLHLTEGVLEIRGTAWEGKLLESSAEKNHHRDVPLSAECVTLLRAIPPRIDTPWLFPAPEGGLWRYSNWRRRVWKPLLEDANTPNRVSARDGLVLDPVPNDFRHSWVSHLRAARIDPADMAMVAGHSVETAHAHYTHALGRSFDAIRSVVG